MNHLILLHTPEPSRRCPGRRARGHARGLGLLLLAACGRDITYATLSDTAISDTGPAPGGDTAPAAGAVDENTEGTGSEGAGEAAAGSNDADNPSTAGVEDTRPIGLEPPGLLDEPPSRHDDADVTGLGGDGADAGVAGDEASRSCWRGEVAAPAAAETAETAEPEPLAGQLHCPLLLEWGEIVSTGPADCQPLSSTLGALWFEWQGGTLAAFDPAATPFASVGAKLERMRRCARDVPGGREVWRFEESFELAGPLPSGKCPTQAFGARFHYTESGKLPGPGVVFGADQPEACEYEACVRFVPSTSGVAAAPGSSEAQCAAPSLPDEPTHAAAIGERCRLSYECEAGSFCSLERDDGSCGFPGEEVCQRAPRLEECSSDLELVCPCYRAALADSNRCEQNARGVSVGSCP